MYKFITAITAALLLALPACAQWGRGTGVVFRGGVVPNTTTFTGGTLYIVSGGDTLQLDIVSAGRILTDEDTLTISIGNASLLHITSAGLTTNNAAGGAVLDEAASVTNPTIVPNKANSGTGVGSAGAASVSLILNATNYLELNVNGAQLTDNSNTLRAFENDGGRLKIGQGASADVEFEEDILLLAGKHFTIGEASNIIIGSTTGTKIGTSTNNKIAFHNSTPVIQRAGLAGNQDAVAAGAATNVAPWGYATQAEADQVKALLNEIRAALVEKGLIKGAN